MDRQYYNQNVPSSAYFHNTVDHVFEQIINVVGSTFGPHGTHNLMMQGTEIVSSKDGLENLELMDMNSTIPRAILGMAREVAGEQGRDIGDGTTTVLLVMAYVYKRLRESDIWNDYTASHIHRCIQKIQENTVQLLLNTAKSVENEKDVFDIAYTSTDRSMELSDILVDIYNSTPNLEDTNIILETTNSPHTSFKKTSGFEYIGTLGDQAFANHDINQFVLRNVKVIVADGGIKLDKEIVEYSNLLKTRDESLLILCTGLDSNNFYHMVSNLMKSQPTVFHNFAIVYTTLDSSHYTSVFTDMVKLLGASPVPQGTHVNKQYLEDYKFGECKVAIFKNRKITLSEFDDTNPLILDHLYQLETQISNIKDQMNNSGENSQTRTMLNVQLSNLKSRYQSMKQGTTTVYVGGETSQRRTINHRLIEDGIKAIQNALKTGYFEGCSSATMNALYDLAHEYYSQNKTMTLDIQLIEIILNAYFDVFTHMINNREKTQLVDFLPNITKYGAETIFVNCKDTKFLNLRFDENALVVFQPFKSVNLSDDETASRILNPAGSDIQVIEKAIDSAVVLATSNTIMTSEAEFPV